MDAIYLDYNATTPVEPEVLDAMLPFLRADFGNPSSAYAIGRRARNAIEAARETVATLIGANADEIIFTSGGTEASNTAIRSAAVLRPERRQVVTSNIEHPATQACCSQLQAMGYYIVRISSAPDGIVSARSVEAAVDVRTSLVSIIHAQNEIGTLQPIAQIGRAAKAVGALVHTDAAQSLGKVPIDVNALDVDFLTIAGHKLYAPKGIGALYVRRGVELRPLLAGAGQERGLRPGTENVAYIAGLGAACRIAAKLLEAEGTRLSELTSDLFARLSSRVPGLVRVGHPTERLPNTLNVLFPRVVGRSLLDACPHVFASTGSACHAGSDHPSAVLTALGIGPEQALGAVRLSLGRGTTADHVEQAASELGSAWSSMRKAA